ncbi:Hypothetical protein A7982_13421 [Minicystis rosea]|nr:Hypothetical protein A7982_13421 [Minicystis rosea]
MAEEGLVCQPSLAAVLEKSAERRCLRAAFALPSIAGMMNHRSLASVLLSLLFTFAGACAPDDPTVSMDFVEVAPASMGPAFFAGQCLDRTPPLVSGGVACTVVEARRAAEGACACDASAGRVPVAAAHEGILSQVTDAPQAEGQGWNCFCEIAQLAGDAALACQNNASADLEVDGAPVDGFCYVDQTIAPAIGEISTPCPVDERRFVRFVGQATQGNPSARTTRIIACDLGAGTPAQ